MEEKLVACAKCRKALAVKADSKMNTCPFCGSKLVKMKISVERWQILSQEERQNALEMVGNTTTFRSAHDVDNHNKRMSPKKR